MILLRNMFKIDKEPQSQSLVCCYKKKTRGRHHQPNNFPILRKPNEMQKYLVHGAAKEGGKW